MRHAVSRLLGTLMGITVLIGSTAGTARAAEEGIESLWYLSPGIGRLDFEGDEAVEDGWLVKMRLGYDYSESWAFEADLSLAPSLNENFYGRTVVENGQAVRIEQVSALDEANGFSGVHDCYAVGLGLDAMYHFTRWKRLDPYLTVGGEVRWYSEDQGDGSSDLAVRAGGGVLYHFNDEWAVRADGRMFVAGDKTEANSSFDVGFVWTWGARVPKDLAAVDGPLDSDGDGLVDTDEAAWKTDPLDPDTDKDGLTDGEEVHTYKTNPLERDTDYDQLTDGGEVKKYRTNPLDRDTDDGGVADGHEVLEDGTNPLHGPDDLMRFELHIQFEYDKAVIKAEYFDDVDVIVKVLQRHPEATAKIEGHADRTVKSEEDYNIELSSRRAKSVLEYMVSRGKIDRSRLSAKGYGFSVPLEPNDPKNGNPRNRRVEVYISGAGKVTS